jgi:L-ascorbate metabolism protein UlaG (beta-lactamase superfamily)
MGVPPKIFDKRVGIGVKDAPHWEGGRNFWPQDRRIDDQKEEPMMKGKRHIVVLLLVLIAFVSVAQAQNVKITPIGLRTGEFCALDRALLFEDPTGVRILYDPGNTTAGATDPRLGDVHSILVTHAHGDHLGAVILNQNPDAGNAVCAGNFPSITTPNSSTAEIAAAKNSAVFANATLANFIARKIANVLGIPATAGCLGAGLRNEVVVPLTSPCTAPLNSGAKRTVRLRSSNRGVQINGVTAEHPSEPPLTLLNDQLRTILAANGANVYVGLAQGFVITFTNGLKVYLSGDTGWTHEMDSILKNFFGVNLVVMNISDSFVTGPPEAAFAISLIQPAAVIPSHANEVATTGGIVNSGTRTAQFISLISELRPEQHNEEHDKLAPPRRVQAHVPLSGVTMQFDGDAQCVSGCRR